MRIYNNHDTGEIYKYYRLLIYICKVRFIKPYRNSVYKCTGFRQGFMKGVLWILQ